MQNKKRWAPKVKFKSHGGTERVLKINGVNIIPEDFMGPFKLGDFTTVAIYAT